MGGSREIGKWATACAAVGAAASAVFAGYATLKTDNEVGTAAFALIGLYMGIVALAGRLPRVKHGETEIDPGTLKEAAREAADTLSGVARKAAELTEDPRAVAEAVSRSSESAVNEAVASLSIASLNRQSVQPDLAAVLSAELGEPAEVALLRALPFVMQLRLLKSSGVDVHEADDVLLKTSDQWPEHVLTRVKAGVRRFLVEPRRSSWS